MKKLITLLMGIIVILLMASCQPDTEFVQQFRAQNVVSNKIVAAYVLPDLSVFQEGDTVVINRHGTIVNVPITVSPQLQTVVLKYKYSGLVERIKN